MSKELVILLSSIGAIQSYFLGIYVLTEKDRKSIQNLLLGSLFLMLALRVTKSVLWAFWQETPLWFINLGFAAHAVSGPLLVLYLYYYLSDHKSFHWFNILHFIPFLIVATQVGQLQLSSFWYQGAYSVLLYHQLFYMLIGLGVLLYYYLIKKTRIPATKSIWIIVLWAGVTIWGLAYFSNYILRTTSYLSGPIFYSGIIYILSFIGFRNQQLFKRKSRTKYQNLKLTTVETSRYKSKLLEELDSGKPFLDPDFNISRLSKLISVPSHILSHIINDHIQLNFSEFINSYRVDEAKRLLQNPKFSYYKISSIASECGFNSLSSFNTAFKKITKMTPSEFRDTTN